MLAKFFADFTDYRISAELIWCCASFAVGKVAGTFGVNLNSHKSKVRFADGISFELGGYMYCFER